MNWMYILNVFELVLKIKVVLMSLLILSNVLKLL